MTRQSASDREGPARGGRRSAAPGERRRRDGPFRRPRAGPPRLEAVAAIVQRLAVLLAAGVAPLSAWDYLDEEESPLVPRAAALVRSGTPVADAVAASIDAAPPGERAAWRALAAAWSVATGAGAPLAPSLRPFAASLRSLADAQRDIAVALAAPAATARLVMALPVVGVLFGMLLGFDTLGVLFATAPGAACLVLGLVLMGVALLWNRRLVARAQPADLAPGLRYELTAIAVSGGGALDRATASVDAALAGSGIGDGEREGVAAVLALSRRAGVPAGELLRSEAEEARRTARAAAAAQAAVLGVRLMLPLGLCILPAFMVLSVAPLLIAVVTTTVGGM